MENVKMSKQGDKLVIEVDLKHRGGKSSTGKTVRIASTEGNVALDGLPEVKIGLNVFTKPE
jgi:hypothetical protein